MSEEKLGKKILLQKTTEKYAEWMKENGYELITPKELEKRLAELGYSLKFIENRISRVTISSEANNLNGLQYRERYYWLVCNETGHNFCNVKAFRKNMAQLQELRRKTTVFNNGLIWFY